MAYTIQVMVKNTLNVHSLQQKIKRFRIIAINLKVICFIKSVYIKIVLFAVIIKYH